MIIAIDIDGIICEDLYGDYENSVPYSDAVEKINQLYHNGHQIWIFTSRGERTGIDWQAFTENQLSDWGIKFHKLIMGKPSFHVLVDDRAISSLDKLDNKMSVLKKDGIR